MRHCIAVLEWLPRTWPKTMKHKYEKEKEDELLPTRRSDSVNLITSPVWNRVFALKTEEVHEISPVMWGNSITYKIHELDGTPIKRTFYANELQRVQVQDLTVWRIDKILNDAWIICTLSGKGRFANKIWHESSRISYPAPQYLTYLLDVDL